MQTTRIVEFKTHYRAGKPPVDMVLLAPAGPAYERTRTWHRIKDLMPPDYVDDTTRMISRRRKRDRDVGSATVVDDEVLVITDRVRSRRLDRRRRVVGDPNTARCNSSSRQSSNGQSLQLELLTVSKCVTQVTVFATRTHRNWCSLSGKNLLGVLNRYITNSTIVSSGYCFNISSSIFHISSLYY
jgi:hypothetical protein